jgi:hypothetical protein
VHTDRTREATAKSTLQMGPPRSADCEQHKSNAQCRSLYIQSRRHDTTSWFTQRFSFNRIHVICSRYRYILLAKPHGPRPLISYPRLIRDCLYIIRYSHGIHSNRLCLKTLPIHMVMEHRGKSCRSACDAPDARCDRRRTTCETWLWACAPSMSLPTHVSMYLPTYPQANTDRLPMYWYCTPILQYLYE